MYGNRGKLDAIDRKFSRSRCIPQARGTLVELPPTPFPGHHNKPRDVRGEMEGLTRAEKPDRLPMYRHPSGGVA